MFKTLEAARKLASRKPQLGTFIARLEIPDEVECVETGSSGHHNVYANSQDLLSYVQETIPVTL